MTSSPAAMRFRSASLRLTASVAGLACAFRTTRRLPARAPTNWLQPLPVVVAADSAVSATVATAAVQIVPAIAAVAATATKGSA